MINEKQLIEVLKSQKHILTFEDSNPIDEGFNSGIDKAIQLIETQPKVGEWMPFKKEEPKEEGLYLCCFDDGFITTVENEDGDWILWADSGEVLAWQPLPEPYEVKE